MKTKPRGIHANFTTSCTCGGDLTISNGRIEHHECREPERVIWATHEEVAEGQEIRQEILGRLEKAFNNL